MKKEIILAIFLGFIVGLAITYGIYTANQAINGNSVKKTSASASPDTTTDENPQASPSISELTLEITEPYNNLVVKTNSVEIKGNTSPNNFVAVMGEDGESIVAADKEGFFRTEIGLISGINSINIVSSTRDNSEQMQKNIEIVYSEAEIE